VADEFELILVNDGSKDQSWEVICELSAGYPWICGVDLMRNYGQHNALLCGIRTAQYDIIVTMDDDLQNPPEEIPHLLEKFKEGYDVVYGTPDEEQHGFWRDIASRVTKMALKSAMSAEVARSVSTFRAFRTELRDTFLNYQCPFICIDVLLTWGTTRFGSIPVRHEARTMGESQYTLRKLITHALNMMTGFSTLPLQLASMMGFILTGFGFGVLIYVFALLLLYGRNVPGFAFLASIISIFSGAQLFALGIIGEYLARMHFRTMERPIYTVRKMLKNSQMNNFLTIREIKSSYV
jgi:undecaprenyl-phosphate 4-deoxy-4-formamido-L-arabinose transferase